MVEIGSRCTQLCYVVAHLVSRAIGSDEFNADQLVAVELKIKIGEKLKSAGCSMFMAKISPGSSKQDFTSF